MHILGARERKISLKGKGDTESRNVANQLCLEATAFQGLGPPTLFADNLPSSSVESPFLPSLPLSYPHFPSSPSPAAAGLGSARSSSSGSGQPQKHLGIFSGHRGAEMCLKATIFVGISENAHLKFLNQNGRQLRVHYASGPIDTAGVTRTRWRQT